jgi:hypothetical protein
MRVIELPQITSTGAKGAMKLETENPTIYITANVGVFSAQPQVSHDGDTWFNVGSALTGTGITTITGRVAWLRLNCGTVGTSLDAAYVAG